MSKSIPYTPYRRLGQCFGTQSFSSYSFII